MVRINVKNINNLNVINNLYSGTLLTVGSETPSHKKTENFQFDTMTWTALADYPFGKQITAMIKLTMPFQKETV